MSQKKKTKQEEETAKVQNTNKNQLEQQLSTNEVNW